MKRAMGWLLVLMVALFWQFFFRGLHPFPGNYLMTWFEPWKTETGTNGIPAFSHKAVVDDAVRQLYPFRTLAWDLIKRGEWPLWNPYNGAGQPLLATMHPGFLNPVGLLSLLFLPQIRWSIVIIAQVVLLGSGMYLYVRKIGLSRLTAFFSIATIVFSGFVVARLEYGEYIYGLAYLPFLLYLYEMFRKNPMSKSILFLPVVLFFLFVSAHPQAIFYTLLTWILYVLYRHYSEAKKLELHQEVFLMLLCLIGVGLAALQLIPTVELYRLSAISTSSSAFIFQKFLLHPQDLITILIPNYFGNQGTYNFWGHADYVETVLAIGLIPMFFAVIASVMRPKNQKSLTYFYISLTVISILVTLDWFFTKVLYTLPVPILSTGIPTRVFMLTTFAVSILSGIGYDAWFNTIVLSKSVKRVIFVFIALILGIFFLTAWVYLRHSPCSTMEILNCRSIALRNTILEIAIFSSAAILLLLYRIKKLKFLSWLIVGIVVAIGWYNSSKFLPFSAKETFYPVNGPVTAIGKIQGNDRLLGLGTAAISTDIATALRIYDPEYYDPLYIRRYGELVSFANSGFPDRPIPRSDVEIVRDINIPQQDIAKRRDRLLDLLSVRFLLLKNSEIALNSSPIHPVWKSSVWQIWERQTALPRVYLVHTIEVVRDRKALLKRLLDTSFDSSMAVLLEENPTVPPIGMIPGDAAAISSYQENKIIVKTHASQPDILVLTDNYYPGWKATVDGVEVPIYRANYTFRAVGVPEGDHTVIFFYYPRSLKLGIAVSGFSLFLFILCILFRLSFNKRKKGFAVR